MEKRYKIHEVAKQLGIAPSAIRFYEKKGLFEAKKDECNGYRYYDQDDIGIIWSIIYHRTIDMSLDTIKDFKDLDSLAKKGKMIQRQKDLSEINIAKEKNNLKAWDFYGKLVEQIMTLQNALIESNTEPIHLFNRSFLNNHRSSIYPVCLPITIFSNESLSSSDISVYTMVHEEVIDLLTDEDRNREKELIPPFPCINTFLQESSEHDDTYVLKKALKLAKDQRYEVRPPYYVTYLLSTGGWDNNQRYYEVFMSLK